MKKLLNLTLILWFVLTSHSFNVIAADVDSTNRAKEILRQVDDTWRGESSHGIFQMRVKTEHYERSLTMESWSKGTQKSLARILSPLKEKGTATLKSENTIYTYLPRTDRTIRLTSGMMSGSWMGSHFTNDDLVQDSRMEEDYIPSITFEGDRNSEQIIAFTLIPNQDAAVVWGRVDIIVRKKDFLILSRHDYDEDGELVREWTFSAIKNMGGRVIPTVLKVVPKDKNNEFTEIVYEEMKFDVPLKDSLFSIAQLRRK